MRSNAVDGDTRDSMTGIAAESHRRQSMCERFSDFTDAYCDIADRIGSPVRSNLIQRVGNRIGRPAPGGVGA